MKNVQRKFMLVSLLLLSALLLMGGCAGSPAENAGDLKDGAGQEEQVEQGKEVNDDEEKEANKPGEQDDENSNHTELQLYFLKDTGTSFEVGVETHEFAASRVGAAELVEKLLEGPETEDLSRVIPEETELLDTYVEEGTAYVNFSAGLREAQLGSEAEAVLVNTIVLTLTQLDEVDQVQLLIDGERVETILGHVYVYDPLS